MQEHEKDISRFISNRLSIINAEVRWGLSAPQIKTFTQAVLDACEGSFYACHFLLWPNNNHTLEEFVEGKNGNPGLDTHQKHHALTGINNLPKGLDEILKTEWHNIIKQAEGIFGKAAEDTLTTIATLFAIAKEPITLETLNTLLYTSILTREEASYPLNFPSQLRRCHFEYLHTDAQQCVNALKRFLSNHRR